MGSDMLFALKRKFTKSKRKITVLEPDVNSVDTIRSKSTWNWEISEASLLGTIVYETGGIIFDGWVRVLGSGERNIADWNNTLKLNDLLVVADDILGGLFGLNIETDFIYYFAPDTLRWEEMNVTYAQFLQWLTEGNVDMFYESLRWDGWEDEVSSLNFSDGLSCYPPLWAVEGNKSRKPMSLREIVLLSFEMQKTLDAKND